MIGTPASPHAAMVTSSVGPAMLVMLTSPLVSSFTAFGKSALTDAGSTGYPTRTGSSIPSNPKWRTNSPSSPIDLSFHILVNNENETVGSPISPSPILSCPGADSWSDPDNDTVGYLPVKRISLTGALCPSRTFDVRSMDPRHRPHPLKHHQLKYDHTVPTRRSDSS